MHDLGKERGMPKEPRHGPNLVFPLLEPRQLFGPTVYSCPFSLIFTSPPWSSLGSRSPLAFPPFSSSSSLLGTQNLCEDPEFASTSFAMSGYMLEACKKSCGICNPKPASNSTEKVADA